MKPNAARLKTAKEFKRAEFAGEFGQTALRAILFALYEIQMEMDVDDVMSHLRDLVKDYQARRDELMALADAIARKRARTAPEEAEAARVLYGRIRNERLG